MARSLAVLLALLLVALQPAALGLPARRPRRKAPRRGLGEEGGRVGAALAAGYLDSASLERRLRALAARCKVAHLHNLGSSVEGRALWALEMSDDAPGAAARGEPHVKYVGGVHGDEPTGRVLGLALAEWLCANYRAEPRARRIVSSMHLWIVPAMNPDGFERRTRENRCVHWQEGGGTGRRPPPPPTPPLPLRPGTAPT